MRSHIATSLVSLLRIHMEFVLQKCKYKDWINKFGISSKLFGLGLIILINSAQNELNLAIKLFYSNDFSKDFIKSCLKNKFYQVILKLKRNISNGNLFVRPLYYLTYYIELFSGYPRERAGNLGIILWDGLSHPIRMILRSTQKFRRIWFLQN